MDPELEPEPRAPGRQTGQPGEAEDENGIAAELARRAAGDVDPIDRPSDDMSMDALDAADADDDAAVLSRPD